ncbi:hypothetical protein P7C73_g218, partial [Tremellales sp. Uapishka_1]
MSPMTKPLLAQSRVLIVGGGISGLALGQSLFRARIPFTIFERDQSASFRAQGYRISHNEIAQRSLKSLVGEDFYGKIRAMGTGDLNAPGLTAANAITGEDLGLFGKGGGAMGSKFGQKPSSGDKAPSSGDKAPSSGDKAPSSGDKAPPVRPFQSDRTVLRGLLALDLESHISYGKRFVDFSTSEQGHTVVARFEDGTTEEGAMIIGGDGIRSKVYSQLLRTLNQPPPNLLDLERRVIYGKTRFSPEFIAAFPDKWAKSISFFRDTNSDTKWLFMDPVIFGNRAEDLTDGRVVTPENYLYWAFITKPEDYGLPDKELFSLTPEQTAELSLKMTETWNPNLRSLLQHQDVSECAVLGVQAAHPDIPERKSHPTATVMGDAVHAMSPTGGAGANTALRDAALLSTLLKEAWNADDGWKAGTIQKVIEAYETEMLAYAREVLAGSFNTPPAKMMMGGKQPSDYKSFAA